MKINLSSILHYIAGLFGDNRIIMEVLHFVKTLKNCNNSDTWEWVLPEYDRIPGHACGLTRQQLNIWLIFTFISRRSTAPIPRIIQMQVATPINQFSM